MLERQEEQGKWEYRERHFEPDKAIQNLRDGYEQSPEYITWLIETLESIENSKDGWQMVRAKIESDERGTLRLEVLMKRPLIDLNQRSSDAAMPSAA